MNKKSFYLKLIILFIILTAGSCSKQEYVWLRGNMHTHTFWSDGDDFPENVVKWYKENGYNFLVLTDHNTILEGERWRNFPESHPTLVKYLETYGNDWVEMQPEGDKKGIQKVRLKTLNEFCSMFEEPDKFMVMMGNEISNPFVVHLIALHQDRIIPPVSDTVQQREEIIRRIVENIKSYREETGRNVYPILAHPNFGWAITAEMILAVPELRFFEVYNGHPIVNNEGDLYRASTERIWDIVLSLRLANGSGELLYGVATDDAHNYHGGEGGPGKGWVMVRSKNFSPDAILEALDRGDFYASTGVILKNISFNGKTLKIEIEPEDGIKYKTDFIGTLKGFDSSSVPTTDAEGNEIENTTRTYSKEIGKVLATSNSTIPSYTFTGDELYVRVNVTSTADQIDPNSGKLLGKQKAWVQPTVKGD